MLGEQLLVDCADRNRSSLMIMVPKLFLFDYSSPGNVRSINTIYSINYNTWY